MANNGVIRINLDGSSERTGMQAAEYLEKNNVVMSNSTVKSLTESYDGGKFHSAESTSHQFNDPVRNMAVENDSVAFAKPEVCDVGDPANKLDGFNA